MQQCQTFSYPAFSRVGEDPKMTVFEENIQKSLTLGKNLKKKQNRKSLSAIIQCDVSLFGVDVPPPPNWALDPLLMA